VALPAARALLLLFATSVSARAQVLEQYFPAVSLGDEAFRLDTVASRNRSEFDNGGIQVGSFVIRPNVEESFGYDDNILGSHERLASAEERTQFALSGATTWSRNGLSASITADDVRYLSQPAQSFTNWTANLGGSYDIGRGKATLAYSHMSLNLQPGEIDNLVAGVPVPFQVDDVHATYLADLGRITLEPELGFTRYHFARLAVDGIDVGAEAGDRSVVSGAATAAYEFDTARKILLSVRGSYSAFDNGFGQPLRNNTGLTALVGADYTANALIRYRVLVGYAERLYQNAAYRTITAPVAEGSLIWTPQRLTTVTLTGVREIQDSIDASVVGYTYTEADLVVDHELRRNLLLQLRSSAQLANYAQNAGPQTIYAFGGRVEWYLNRFARLTGDYSHSIGHNPDTGIPSDPAQGGYDRNVVLFSLRLQL
jgi:hypothetical protein